MTIDSVVAAAAAGVSYKPLKLRAAVQRVSRAQVK